MNLNYTLFETLPSIHSHLPIHPIRYDVIPPSQFPARAVVKHIHGLPPAINIPIIKASAENGTMVEAKNEPINNPKYPNSKRPSMCKFLCLQNYYLLLYV